MASVVVIDDDRSINRMICKSLEKEGYQRYSAYTLSDGYKAECRAQPEVVFLDHSMPDGNGLAWLPDLLDVESAPEVIVITATGSGQSVENAIFRGAWDYVQKPFLEGSLAHLVRQPLRYRHDKQGKKNWLR